MKKLLIITLILFVSFTSMSFKGCYGVGWILLFFWQAYDQTQGVVTKGDGQLNERYSIYVGDNGIIFRSSGETNITFEQKTSGSTQRLNSVRATPSTFFETVVSVGNNGAIVLSTNTGNTWSVSASGTSANLYGVDFNNIYYFAAGDNGTIVYSLDGSNWFPLSSGTTRNLKAVSLSNQFASNVIAVGEKGTIIRSTDSGTNWTNVSLSDTTINFYDISKKGTYYTDGNNFCIVGTGGRIYKSTNGGATWVQKPSGTTNNLRSIYQHTADSIVVVGDNGTVRFSTNGGESWFTDSYFNSPSTRNYKAVSLVNRDYKTYSALSDTIWFVSEESFIIGIEPISTEVPNGFSLYQNYPNPFNPGTVIRFQVSSSSSVKLIVYDVTGREIETLVDHQLGAGSYIVDFDGSRIASGVYYYKLIANDFVETRKMVLIK